MTEDIKFRIEYFCDMYVLFMARFHFQRNVVYNICAFSLHSESDVDILWLFFINSNEIRHAETTICDFLCHPFYHFNQSLFMFTALVMRPSLRGRCIQPSNSSCCDVIEYLTNSVTHEIRKYFKQNIQCHILSVFWWLLHFEHFSVSRKMKWFFKSLDML